MRDPRPDAVPGLPPPLASGAVAGITAALACLMLGAGALAALAAYAVAGALGTVASALAGARPPVHADAGLPAAEAAR